MASLRTRLRLESIFIIISILWLSLEGGIGTSGKPQNRRKKPPKTEKPTKKGSKIENRMQIWQNRYIFTFEGVKKEKPKTASEFSRKPKTEGKNM